MNVLVTGAGGFLGRHVVSHLATRDCRVTALSRGEIHDHGSPNITPGRLDRVDEATDWTPWLKGANAVVHLAGVAHRRVTHGSSYSEELDRINVQGTARLHAQCLEQGVAHFIFISSLAAITSRSIGRIDALTPSGPTNGYGHSKKRAEEHIAAAASRTTAYTILRPPLIYGPGNPANMARLTNLIRRGCPLPFARVRNRRSFLFTGNFCDAVHRCLTASAARNRTFFLSDDDDASTARFAELIGSALDRPARLLPFPSPLLDLMTRLQPDGALAKLVGSLYVDIAPFRTALNWTPPYRLETGLRMSLASPDSVRNL